MRAALLSLTLILVACGPSRAAVDVAVPADDASDALPLDLVSIDDARDDDAEAATPDVQREAAVDVEASSCGDTQTDLNNCGACGVTCASLHVAGAVCFMGGCVGSCELGWRDCDRTFSDGCEVHAAVDAMNCGTCGSVCDGGSCAGGFCM